MHQMQQQQQQKQHIGAFNTNTITTDHIQQYLDENKALILKILDDQSTGKFGECAENQTRLQRNLMYLAAIADCQPKQSPIHLQTLKMVMQPYMNSMQQQQLQSQHMVPQPHMMAQSPMDFGQQPPFSAMQQQQHALQSQLGISSPGTSGIHTPRSEGSVEGGGFLDFGQPIFGEGSQGMNRLANRSVTKEIAEGGDNPQKKGKFNREVT